MSKVTWLTLSLLFIFNLVVLNTSASPLNGSGFYISPKLIIAHSSIKDGKVSGSYQDPIVLYTDQNQDKTGNNTSDVVGGALFSLGYNNETWRAELSYSYRFRFDLNGNAGEIDPEKYQRHNNIPGRFRLDINTQAIRLDYYYKITSWQTDSLKPFVGISIESLQHNIFAKVRNGYNYSEEKVRNRSVTLGLSLGTEIIWKDNINWTISLHYIDLGNIDIGPQSDNAYFSSKEFNTIDVMFGVNYYF
jgi:opacity protein-like surface antigen